MDYVSAAYNTAVKYGIDPDLFVRQINAESAFNPNAVSSAGAIGLGQLMPSTAKELGVDPNDPLQNLDGAARYMKQQLDRFGDPALALAAYNAGPSRVAKAQGVPNIEETQNYVSKILGGKPMISQPAPQQAPFDRQSAALYRAFMAGDPNKGGQSLIQASIDAENRALALKKQTQQSNATAAYLDRIGQGEIANLLRQGGIDAKTALTAASKGQKDTALIRQAKAAGLKEGTPEFAKYILSGGNIYSQETALMANLPEPEKGKMYKFDRDENGQITNLRLVNISGSKADIEEQNRQTQMRKAATQESTGQNVVSREVQKALRMIKENTGIVPVAGVYGALAAQYLPNQEARDLRRTLDTLKASTAFQRLQQMRDASKTGGALGNVSNVELDLLMSAYGSLSQDLSEKELVENLKEIDRIMGVIEGDAVANAYFKDGVDLRGTELDAQVKQGANKSGNGVTRYRFDANGNLIND